MINIILDHVIIEELVRSRAGSASFEFPCMVKGRDMPVTF